MYRIKERDVIRVKVKYCDDEKEPQIKKFAIDPRLTNYDILLGLLIKGLNIKRDFIIHYLATDDFGEQFYLPLLSDWDLDAAILTASDPTLRLKVNIKRHERDLDEWDIVVPGEAPVRLSKSNLNAKSVSNAFKQSMNFKQLNLMDTQKFEKNTSNSFFNQVYQQMEKTMTSMQRVFSNTKLNETMNKLMKPPMSDIEFRNYMDNIGRIVQPEEFKQSVYLGGLEPSLRKVGWRLLLNIYPLGLTGRERLNLLEVKAKHYRSLKHSWKQKFKEGKLTEQEMAQIALVSVDVIRTDRSLNFYSGEKNQQHVSQLFDILATYCIYHPSIGYYQGMSDLASPLLFVQCEEAVAYLCFCSLMRRIACNFKSNPICQDLTNDRHHSHFEQSDMLAKLQNLHDLIVYLDPQLAMFLREKYLGNFFFAHRWILLEMKREFSFLDSLRLLEVQWASLPPSKYNGSSSSDGVSLVENGLCDSIISGPLCPQHCTNRINKRPTKIRCYAVKDMSLICSLIGSQYTPYSESISPPPPSSSPTVLSEMLYNSLDNREHPENDENNSDFPQSDINESDSNEESVFKFPDHCICSDNVPPGGVTTNGGDTTKAPPQQQRPKQHRTHSHRNSHSEDGGGSETATTACDNNNQHQHQHHMHNKGSHKDRTYSNSSSHDEALIQMKDGVVELPPPEELGHGNPFLLFLCVSLLLEYREVIVKGVTEASDILMLYQKFNQRHNTTQVLNRARMLYDQYLRDQEIKRRNLDEFPEIELTM